MEYNLERIGNRIRDERKNFLHLSQEEFISLVGISRNTLVDIEHGRRLPQSDTLNLMCELFECERGYILCEYDTKHYITADLQTQTGLSESAITNIQKLHQIPRTKPLFDCKNIQYNEMDCLNNIVSCNSFINLLSIIVDYKTKCNTPNVDIDTLANIQSMIAREFLKVIDE